MGAKGRRGREDYRASHAEAATWDRARRPKRCKLRGNRALARIVAAKLRMFWSPEQIAGWLKHTYPCDESLHVSHATIYRSLFIQARGALKKELLEYLRRTRAVRRSRHHTRKAQGLGQIVDAVCISERPASVEDRAVPGHWEETWSSAVARARRDRFAAPAVCLHTGTNVRNRPSSRLTPAFSWFADATVTEHPKHIAAQRSVVPPTLGQTAQRSQKQSSGHSKRQ